MTSWCKNATIVTPVNFVSRIVGYTFCASLLSSVEEIDTVNFHGLNVWFFSTLTVLRGLGQQVPENLSQLGLSECENPTHEYIIYGLLFFCAVWEVVRMRA